LLPVAICLCACALASNGCARGRESDADHVQARAVFAGVCARCHGPEGKGGIPTETQKPPRDLTLAAFQDSITDAEIRDALMKGRAGGMPEFNKTLSEEQMVQLVRFVRTLRRSP